MGSVWADLFFTILYYQAVPLILRMGFHRKAFDKKLAIKIAIVNVVVVWLNWLYIFRVIKFITGVSNTPGIISPILWGSLAFWLLIFKPKWKKHELVEPKGAKDKVLNVLKAFTNSFLSEKDVIEVKATNIEKEEVSEVSEVIKESEVKE
jgi:hypothetical protein